MLFRPKIKQASASRRRGWPELPRPAFFHIPAWPGAEACFFSQPGAGQGPRPAFFRSRLAGRPKFLKESLRILLGSMNPGPESPRPVFLFAAWRPDAEACFFSAAPPGRLPRPAFSFAAPARRLPRPAFLFESKCQASAEA